MIRLSPSNTPVPPLSGNAIERFCVSVSLEVQVEIFT